MEARGGLLVAMGSRAGTTRSHSISHNRFPPLEVAIHSVGFREGDHPSGFFLVPHMNKKWNRVSNLKV